MLNVHDGTPIFGLLLYVCARVYVRQGCSNIRVPSCTLNQLGRRNLNDAQRIDVVDKLFGLQEKEDAKKRQGTRTDIHGGKFSTKSRDKLGKMAKVSGKTYEKGKGVKGEENFPQVREPQSRDKLGEKAKVSGKTYEKGKQSGWVNINEKMSFLWPCCSIG